ncbi:hypothetical protein ODI_R3045 [Orrella dioscoreae]|uniref:Uncharacterized protein n=2 Tax=Orrella dioscoreae TaxID=1851544 RepID=A0A1C3K3E5_9BURK|nr:hypothetical protein ODI_01766 [Orrella dioscoreae]SOE50896.1 hypothetical protein ODI_R3045 [Orrella dioscoreae]
MKLVEDLQKAVVSSHALASMDEEARHISRYAYLAGGVQALLRNFLLENGCGNAASALERAMNYMPSDQEIDARVQDIQARRAARGTA